MSTCRLPGFALRHADRSAGPFSRKPNPPVVIAMLSGVFSERNRGWIIGGAAVVALIAGAFVRPTPFPPATQATWMSVAIDQQNRVALAGRTFIVDGVTAGAHDRPYRGQITPIRRGTPLVIHGWVLDPASLRSAAGVTYRIDGGALHAATYHQPRADVASVFGLPDGADCGFIVAPRTDDLSAGKHTVRIATFDASSGVSSVFAAIEVDVRAS